MIKINRETKIGFVAVITIALLVWGVNFLKGKNVFKNSKEMHALFNQVDGLTDNAPVILNGMKIGQVYSIRMLSHKQNRVLVSFDLGEKYFIPVGSKAVIYSMDLLGTKAIRIDISNQLQGHIEGDTLASEYDNGLSELLTPIRIEAENIMRSVDTLLLNINRVFDGKSQDNLRASLANIEATTNNLRYLTERNGSLSTSLSNLQSITANISASNQQITNIIGNLSQLSDSLAQSQLQTAINNLSIALAEISQLLDNVNNGKGTLGQLAENDSLYHSLNTLSTELSSLLRDYHSNPSKYMYLQIGFGKNKNK